ncbi:MAG: hypothetical protein MJZ28_12475 [Paludibacteraceae bacterium]|nr:hypothetical protein [Paludibacteraceae bacterium]
MRIVKGSFLIIGDMLAKPRLADSNAVGVGFEVNRFHFVNGIVRNGVGDRRSCKFHT